jgi:GT2 family glycosyltransferase
MTATGIGVVIATCDRPLELHACLESLLAQALPPECVVVVDDRPGGTATPLVLSTLGDDRLVYVAGPGEGLAAAHNVGLEHIGTPIVAFTDDDVVADARWLEHVNSAFGLSPRVACVTGRIVPYELATPAQVLLECYAGFDKGRERRVFDKDVNRPADPLFPFTAGTLGSGANMAFRREFLLAAGGFDAALGTGTRARGGDDLSAFFEVIQRGGQLVYEPAAVVRHRHAREMEALDRQVFAYGVGLTAYLTRCIAEQPRLLPHMMRRLPAALAHVLRSDSAKNARLVASYPARLRRRERVGMLVGPFAYARSRRAAGRAR